MGTFSEFMIHDQLLVNMSPTNPLNMQSTFSENYSQHKLIFETRIKWKSITENELKSIYRNANWRTKMENNNIHAEKPNEKPPQTQFFYLA